MTTCTAWSRIVGVYILFAFHGNAWAGDATWNQTAASTTYNWTNTANWLPNTTYPNGPGETAIISNDVAGAQTIRLQTNITLGTLHLGDAVASGNNFGIAISAGTGSNRLRMRQVQAQGTNYIYMSASTGTPTHTISAALDLAPNSPLVITMGQSQKLTLSGTLATNDSAITLEGGNGLLTLDANLIGSGTVVKNNSGDLLASSSIKDFTGDWLLNSGIVTIVSGSLRNSGSAFLNGTIYDVAGTTTRTGGCIQVGSASTYAADPGQRLPHGVITLNGGWLTLNGQSVATNNLGQYLWTNAVIDTVNEFRLNETYSMLQISFAASSLGTHLNAGSFTRAKGGTMGLRGNMTANMSRFLYTNSTDFLLGAGGSAGSQTMSIIPWMVVANSNASAANPADWGTYLPGLGVRALNPGEYTNGLIAGGNVASGALGTLAADTSINTFKQNNSGTTTIGTNRTLTIASGGLMFVNGSGKFGTPGTNTGGTLNFGAAEGVIWALPPATNVIGAVITGSNGLTKAGLGMLALAAPNTYTGQTTVSAGSLIAGDGAVGGNLGRGDVVVALGARLLIYAVSTNAIWDSASVRLAHTNTLYARLELATGVDEKVNTLYLGGAIQPAGTYGSSAAAATFTNDAYFTGAGLLRVQTGASPKLTGTVFIVR